LIEHAYADVNGVRLHYAFCGGGPLIMFLHGFPEYWDMWKEQLKEFGKDHMAVAPDMRGYNLSSKPQEVSQYKQKYLIEDIRQLAEYLGYKKFTLVAHDWGGAVAWTFAMFYPQYLETLIIVNSPYPVTFERELRDNPEQRKASSYMLFFRSPEAEKKLSENNYSWLLNMAFGDIIKSGVLKEEDIQGYINAWSQPGALTGGLNYYRATNVAALENLEEALKRPALGESLPVITVPTLVIWGEKDKALLIGCVDGLEKYIPNLSVKRIPDASHWVVREKPGQVNLLIREFLKRKYQPEVPGRITNRE
jgi:pimeloyl-ACP methyl ester carboxylesterase